MSSCGDKSAKVPNYRSNKNSRRTDKEDDTSGNTRYDLRNIIRGKRKTTKFPNDEEDRKGSLNKSWADQCEEFHRADLPQDENSVSTPLKNLTMDSPAKGRYFSASLEKEENQNGQVKTRSNKKRERNVDIGADYLPLSPSTEGVKRRLGWSRTKFSAVDTLSTTSSSTMYSSDNEFDGDKSGKQFETDPDTLRRRQKQIDYGKNTKGYRMYLQAIPKFKREPHHIFTPKKHIKYSRRSWDTQIKLWRKRLHEWDTSNKSDEEEADVDLSDMVGLI